MLNRTKDSTKVFSFGVISNIITILCPFVIRTIIIYKLGANYAGLNGLFSSVLSILNMSELGIGSAITFCLYKPVASNDYETINSLTNYLKKIYKYIGIFLLVAGLLITPFLSYLIKSDYPKDINIYVLFIIFLLNSVSTYEVFPYNEPLLYVYIKGDITYKVKIIAEIVKYVLQIIALLLFANFYVYLLILPLSTVFGNVLLDFRRKKILPNITPKGELNTELKGVIRSKVFFLSAHSVAAAITGSIDNIVISSSIGLMAVTLYGNYSYISSSVLGFLLIAFRALQSVVGNVMNTENGEKINEMYNSTIILALWVLMWCCVTMFCLFQPFIILWLGKQFLLDTKTVVIIVAYFFSNGARQLLTTSYIGTAGLWNKTLARQIIAAVMNLVLDILLVNKWGIFGIVFASFVTGFFVALPMDIRVTHKYVLKSKATRTYLSIAIAFVYTVIMSFALNTVCSMFPFSGILNIAIRFIICLIVPNAVTLLLLCKTKEFKYIFQHLLLIKK